MLWCMRYFRTAALILFLCFLCACGSTSAAGSYRLIEIRDDDSGLLITEANLNGMGEYTMELKDDGSGTFDMAGAVSQLRWDDQTIVIAGGAPQEYTLSGRQLKLQDEGAMLTFEKE